MVLPAPPSQELQDTLTALQQRNLELERALQDAAQQAQISEAIIQHLPVTASVWHLEQPDDPSSFRLIAANPANKHTVGFDLSAEVGRRMVDIFGSPKTHLQLFVDVLRSGQPRDLGEIESQSERLPGAIFSVQAIPLPHNHLCLLGENITARKRTEEMVRQSIAQEETIRAQQAALAELSTPLIPLSERVLVMPLVGAVDSHRAQQVLTALLEGIAGSRAQVAILDITGVAIVDTQVANALIRAAQAVKLLGAQVVLTGIRPEVAQTLVGLGADLSGIITRSNLQSGIAYATNHN
jgi:rsbT co-antagonist protein RsbR